jgi:transcription elongation factor GreA
VQGLHDAQEELEFLKKIKRDEIAQRIAQALEFGDLGEDSDYDAVLNEQSMCEGRIVQLEMMLRDASLIQDGEDKPHDAVSIGSTVIVQIDRKNQQFTIVGKFEANPLKGRISNESPVGGALMGAKAGEVIEITTPSIKYKCKVLEIK